MCFGLRKLRASLTENVRPARLGLQGQVGTMSTRYFQGLLEQLEQCGVSLVGLGQSRIGLGHAHVNHHGFLQFQSLWYIVGMVSTTYRELWHWGN